MKKTALDAHKILLNCEELFGADEATWPFSSCRSSSRERDNLHIKQLFVYAQAEREMKTTTGARRLFRFNLSLALLFYRALPFLLTFGIPLNQTRAHSKNDLRPHKS